MRKEAYLVRIETVKQKIEDDIKNKRHCVNFL